MNRQVNYIISAFLILSIFAGIYFLIPVFSFTSPDKTGKEYFIPQISTTTLTNSAAIGKALFMSKCASCHQVLKNGTGPALAGFEDRGPWVERKNLYDWIKNPAAFIASNEYARELKKVYGGTVMTAFPDLTNEEIDAICDYISDTEKIRALPIAKR
jgi:mono/diheme cytochrome c family protein